MLVGSAPEHMLVPAHKHQVSDHVVSGSHRAGPAFIVITDRVKTERG